MTGGTSAAPTGPPCRWPTRPISTRPARRLDIIDSLPAPAVRAAIVRDRHDKGLPVPRGPRAPKDQNNAGLTARELDVLALLVDGLSDADIAGALFLSRKTVGHHVSAVLRKLDAPSRSRAVATAMRRGILRETDAPSEDRGS